MPLAPRSNRLSRRAVAVLGVAVLAGAVGVGGRGQARTGAQGDRGMDVVVRLRAGEPSAGAARAEVAEVLRRHGAALTPMHPGSADAAMAAWFVVQAPSPERAEAIAAALRALGSVEAAYVQPRPAPA